MPLLFLPFQAKDEINVPIALSAFRDNPLPPPPQSVLCVVLVVVVVGVGVVGGGISGGGGVFLFSFLLLPFQAKDEINVPIATQCF